MLNVRTGGLLAACLFAAAGVALAVLLGGMRDGGQDRGGGEVQSLAAPAPPVRALAVPPRPKPPSPFRELPASLRAEMTELTEDGLRLPRPSSSGWLPWIAYARRFEASADTARVGVLMVNLGVDAALTRRAVEELPGEVSLAFLPGSPDLQSWLRQAHERGHETYLMLPMDDQSVPAERGLRPVEASLDAAENVRRLRSAMSRGEGYVGFVVVAANAAWQSEPVARPLLEELARRGLGLVEVNAGDASSTVQRLTEELGMGYARTRDVLDYKLSEGGLAANLDRLDAWASESVAGDTPRHRFGVVQPDGVAIDTISAWIRGRPSKPAAALVPVIGHFECRDACMARLRVQPEQLKP